MPGAEISNVGGVVGEKLRIVRKIKFRLFDADLRPSFAEGFALNVQLGFGDFIEPHLIEEMQQPRLAVFELLVFQELVPDRQRAPDQLIAARRIHAINAHVHAADTDRAFGGKRARRVVFGAQQAMARIDRHRARCAEIHIPQPEDQIAGVENDVFHVFTARQPVGALDEIDVIRQPRCFCAHGLLIAFDRAERGGVFKRHRHVHDTGRDFELADIGQAVFQRQ
ncbi:hypothetical protein SRABI106_04149 [Rahnella aquatilis]|nr:hypothetical protein SRABI106_04149 [Rahnella aquatilis]